MPRTTADQAAAALQAASTEPDPLDRIRAAEQLADLARVLLVDAVDAARKHNRSWTEVGTALGVSRQAAWHRFGEPDTRPPEPPVPTAQADPKPRAQLDGPEQVAALEIAARQRSSYFTFREA